MQIEKRFSILAKEDGWYHAFPTIIRQNETLWMAFRTGRTSNRQAHGVDGRVRLFSADAGKPNIWKDHGVLFKPTTDGTRNELDAILSAPTEEMIFLATRDFEYQKRNDVYLSKSSRLPVKNRTLLTDISNQYIICYGHIRKTNGNRLIMPGYCGFHDEPDGTPILLVSENDGFSWKMRAKVASSTQAGTRLTEYSLGYLGARQWTSLIRSETSPNQLFQSTTFDNGRTWTRAEPTSLVGHAPMIIEMKPENGLLAVYRDLSESDPGVSVGIKLNRDNNWQKLGSLAAYLGSIYDGGYGDVLNIADDRYLAVYYLGDSDRSPWIEGCVFSTR